MPIAYVQSNKGYNSGGNVAVAFPGNVLANSLLIATMHLYDGNQGTAGVTDSRGNSYGSPVFWTAGGDGSLVLALWWAISNGAGACTVTVNPGNGGGRYCSSSILEYSGIATSLPVDVSDTNTGSGTGVTAGPITTTNGADLLVALMTSMAGSNVAITPTDLVNYSQRQEFENGATEMHLNVCDRILAATGTHTPGWTLGSSQGWIGGVVAFKGAAAVAVSDPPPTIARRMAHMLVR